MGEESAIPGWPGTTSIDATLSERASRQAIAYSRPPPPSTRQFVPGAPAERPGLRLARCSRMTFWTFSPSLNRPLSHFIEGRSLSRSLPFDRGRRLRRDVVNDAVHFADLVHDAR